MSSISCAVLMCHAPIVIREVAGNRADKVQATTRAMEEAALRIVRSSPDVLVVVSPHTPRQTGSWGFVDGSRLTGDLRDFGAAEIGIDLPNAHEAISAIRAHAGKQTHLVPLPRLDHGALVPLHFVVRAGWEGPTVVVALPWPGTATEESMGAAIAQAALASGQRFAVLASGDMSHRLIPGAPAGFHPRAREFDAFFVDRIAVGDLRGACEVDENLRDIAGEDVVDSVAVAAGAVGFDSTGHEVLSYEGPFGVGYMEAVLHA